MRAIINRSSANARLVLDEGRWLSVYMMMKREKRRKGTVVSKAYFCPMQFRGPVENGCETFLLSEAKRGSEPSQRSGMNSLG